MDETLKGQTHPPIIMSMSGMIRIQLALYSWLAVYIEKVSNGGHWAIVGGGLDLQKMAHEFIKIDILEYGRVFEIALEIWTTGQEDGSHWHAFIVITVHPGAILFIGFLTSRWCPRL